MRDLNDLRQAMSSIAGGTREPVTCTFVVDRLGTLRLAEYRAWLFTTLVQQLLADTATEPEALADLSFGDRV